MAGDPKNARYAALAAAVALKTGETLLELGRTAGALDHLAAAREAIARLPESPNKRNLAVFTDVHLAELKAHAGDRDAGALADRIATEVATRPLANTFNDALARQD